MSLEGKVALVTGSGGGLGRATAEKLLEEGAKVVVCDVNDELIEDFKQSVASKYSSDRVLILKIDVTSEADLDHLFSSIEQTHGQLDIVVNSAGIIDFFDPMGTMEQKIWDRVLAVNLTAPAFIIKRAVNVFLKNKTKGSIVNVASIAGVRGFSCGAAYTASKHGLLGLTKNTAAFYGSKGIRCNAIMPGAMATNIGASMGSRINFEGYQRMRVNFPEEGGMPMCDISQIAGLIMYLASDKSDVLNGAAIAADGGAMAN